jgi:co-chaperonin GroES (HSP10)
MTSSIFIVISASSTPSPPEVVDVYHHEFASVFRFSHTTSVYKGDYTLLETLDEDNMMPDEEHAVVIISREIMALVARKTMPLPLPASHKRHSSRNM